MHFRPWYEYSLGVHEDTSISTETRLTHQRFHGGFSDADTTRTCTPPSGTGSVGVSITLRSSVFPVTFDWPPRSRSVEICMQCQRISVQGEENKNETRRLTSTRIGEFHARFDMRFVDMPVTGAFWRSCRPLLRIIVPCELIRIQTSVIGLDVYSQRYK